MKVHLGAALALHALVLLAGVRWSPLSRAAEQPVEPAHAQEILIDATPEARPEPAKSVEPPAAARRPGGDGTGGAGTGEHHGAPGRGTVRLPVPDATAPKTLEQALSSLPSLPAAAVATDLAAKSSFELNADPSLAGSGTGTGNGDGFGDGGGGSKSGRKPGGTPWGDGWDHVSGPKGGDREEVTVKADETTLPRKTIDGVVSRNAGRLRACYQDGLRREPDLAGQIPVRFTVSVAGSVIVAADGGATVADPTTVRCVLSTFATMIFPARTQGESVRATYLVAFPPG